MSHKYSRAQAGKDLDQLLKDCIEEVGLVEEALGMVNSKFLDMQRVMSVSHLYALWERFFKQANGICLRLVRARYIDTKKCPSHFATYWFRKSQNFGKISRMFDQFKAPKEVEMETKGPYLIAQEILDTADSWSGQSLDTSVDFHKLVVTFSNVNKDVVDFNARAFEISECSKYKKLDFTQIDNFLRLRNEAVHDGYAHSLGQREMRNLISYDKKLMNSYYVVLKKWMRNFKMT